MNAKQIYALPAIETTTSLAQLDYLETNHLPEITESISKVSHLNEKVVIHTVKEHAYDWDHSWCLYTVWFENVPVMILQEAGKANNHEERFITNQSKFIEMIMYIRGLLQTSESFEDNSYDEEEEIPELTKFYGFRLNEQTLQVESDTQGEIWELHVNHYIAKNEISMDNKRKMYAMSKHFTFENVTHKKVTKEEIINLYHFVFKKKRYELEITESKTEENITETPSYHLLEQQFSETIFYHFKNIFLLMNRMSNEEDFYEIRKEKTK